MVSLAGVLNSTFVPLFRSVGPTLCFRTDSLPPPSSLCLRSNGTEFGHSLLSHVTITNELTFAQSR